MLKPGTLIAILILTLTAAFPTGSSGKDLPAFWKKCVELVTRSKAKSENLRIAEEILHSYKPYDQNPFELETVSEGKGASIFKGIDTLHPENPFVLKVVPLAEALNDYFGLRALKKAQELTRSKISIVDSVLLTPKKEKVSLVDRALEKAPFIKGRPLVEILADPKEPAARKTALLLEYQDWQTEIGAALESLGFSIKKKKVNPEYFKKHERLFQEIPDFEKTQPEMLFASRAWEAFFGGWVFESSLFTQVERLSRGQIQTLLITGADLEIILKSDNVLVDEANRMTLVDPY